MEDQVERLVAKTWAKYQATPKNERLLIAISGIPGSGKTALARAVTDGLNAQSSTPIACFVPMDGYHFSRAELSAMPEPENAHFRRGAAFTFNAAAFLALVQRVRAPVSSATPTILAPSFDHAIKDPVPDDIAIAPSARIVVFEGNYLSLSQPPWQDAARLMDELWFVQVDFDVAKERLWRRHLKAGIVDSKEEGMIRAEQLDLANGREIVEGRMEVQEIVVSREYDSWKTEEQKDT